MLVRTARVRGYLRRVAISVIGALPATTVRGAIPGGQRLEFRGMGLISVVGDPAYDRVQHKQLAAAGFCPACHCPICHHQGGAAVLAEAK